MKKVILLSSVLLAAPFMLGEIGEASAQCTTTPSCSSMGYTTGVNTGNCLKCPTGNYYFCPPKIEPSCDSSYKYTCTGANQAKPSTGACNGKYTSCSCTSGYVWNNGICQRQCIPEANESGCSLGTESCSDGCGGTRYCCIYSKNVTISNGCSCSYDSGNMHCDRVRVSTTIKTMYQDGRVTTSSDGFWMSGCLSNCNSELSSYQSSFQCRPGTYI